MENQRLYIVVNGALSCGAKAAQSLHALAEFAVAEPEAFKAWTTQGNVIVNLQCQDVRELSHLREAVSKEGFKIFAFHEPDLGDQLTAMAFLPTPAVQGRLEHLPLSTCKTQEASTSRQPRSHFPLGRH